MITYDIEFDFYNDEPPRYFSRPANEFDGCDQQASKEDHKEEK